MSRMFTEDGKSIPVTLIEATPNRITQVKTPKPTATAPCR
jgi:large subunit ribosomal protein L3